MEWQHFVIFENRNENFPDFPIKNSDKIGFHERFPRFPDFPILKSRIIGEKFSG